MRGTRPLAVLMVLSMLSACASGTRPQIERRLGDTEKEPPKAYADAVEAATVDANHRDMSSLPPRRDTVPAAHRGGDRRYHHERRAHYHEEPSSEEKAVAETVLLLTGSIFLCTFVVVVLDGACEFGAHTGYYY